jgi:hypothetical protein
LLTSGTVVTALALTNRAMEFRRVGGGFVSAEAREWHKMAQNGTDGTDLDLAVALAEGKTVPEACKATGFSLRTVYRRLQDPEFRELVEMLRFAILQATAGRLATGMVKAADLLCESPSYEGAAKLIELGVKVSGLMTLRSRVEELERRAREATKAVPAPICDVPVAPKPQTESTA